MVACQNPPESSQAPAQGAHSPDGDYKAKPELRTGAWWPESVPGILDGKEEASGTNPHPTSMPPICSQYDSITLPGNLHQYNNFFHSFIHSLIHSFIPQLSVQCRPLVMGCERG